MTEYYDREEVNSKHLVLFSKPKEVDGLHYYDFDTQSWIRCYPQDNLPYGLCSYRLEEKTENESVITCHDSYRLSDGFPEYTNHEAMLEEKKWRDEMYEVGKGYEFDWQLEDGEWVKGGICWTKADIIPGVCVIGPRDCPNLNGWGYHYKESKRYAKASTYTHIITQEELDEEQRQKDEARERYLKRQQRIADWKQKLPRLCPKEYVRCANSGGGLCGPIAFYDILPYYLSLKRDPNETTLESILSRMDPEDAVKIRESLKDNPTMIGLLGLVSQNSLKVKPKDEKYEVIFDSGECVPEISKYLKIEGKENVKSFELTDMEGFFDIRVHNATYCYLKWKHNNREDYMINMVQKDNYLTFEDITYDNPLFSSVKGDRLTFFTDGDKVTYKRIWMDNEPRSIFYGMENSYAISYFPSQKRVLMLGHVWQPSLGCSIDDLVPVDPKPVQEKRGGGTWMTMS